MRKAYSLLYLLLTVSFINCAIAQKTTPLYHPNDLARLKAFMEQSSENNQSNLSIVWGDKNSSVPSFPLSDSGEGWADKLAGVKWENTAFNKQLLSIDWGDSFLQSSLIGNLDLSDCKILRTIICTQNNLTSIKINNVPKLEEVICFSNHLTSIQITNNPSLIKLSCSQNNFTTLDTRTNPALEELLCMANDSLQILDISKNTALKKLNCSLTSLKSLDVTKNTALKELSCVKTPITSLDLTYNVTLSNLRCAEAGLTTLDVSKNTALEQLSCSQTKIKTLDLSQNILLKDVVCSEMPLESLNVTGAKKLQLLHCRETLLKDLDVSKNTELKELNCDSSPLKTMNINGASALTDLSLSRTAITSLDVSNNKNLKNLYCGFSPLASLNISGLSSLETLYCNYTSLSSLDVSTNKILSSLYCKGAKIPFSNLPINQTTYTNYDYCQQDTFYQSTPWSNKVDMTKFLRNGKTEFTWYLKNNQTRPLTDITDAQDGLFSVSEKYAGTKLICKMTNSDFPQFTEKSKIFYPMPNFIDTRMVCEVNITKSMSTGAEEAKQPIQVYSQNGTLFVETNQPSQIMIYTIIGKLREIRKGSEGTTLFELPAGFYIVKVNNQVFKRHVSSN